MHNIEAKQVAFVFAWPGIMLKFCKNPGRPLRCPYLPTYLPTLLLWEIQKEIKGLLIISLSLSYFSLIARGYSQINCAQKIIIRWTLRT